MEDSDLDMSALLGPPTSQQQMQALAAALQKQQQLGQLGQLSGDRVVAPTGTGLVQGAQHQQQMVQQSQDRALTRALALRKEASLEGYRRDRLNGGGPALDPATVIHLRPDVTEALGGEDAVMAMEPRMLAGAIHQYDSKAGLDYKKDALNSRAGAQATRTNVLERSLRVREKKLGLDVGGRQVPGMEMEDGYVLQPKEAAAGKTLRGNVQRSMQALNALRDDFTKYGPDRLNSLGGVLPSEALTRMEGNRARLLEAALGLQGMNPTIGHQELLQHQLREPGDFKNINHAAYLAQLAELEKSIHEAETAFAAGHGVKRLAPLKQPGAPAGVPAVKEERTLEDGRVIQLLSDGTKRLKP